MAYIREYNGGHLTLTRTVEKCYRSITVPLINVKSAFISVCADIDRYLRLSILMDVNDALDEKAISKLKKLYPRLQGLNFDQWNRLIKVFLAIRNENAHLYQNKPIFIDEDILSYLRSLVKPEMNAISKGNELTVYGCYYVLAFLCQKFQFAPFASSLLKGYNFNDMSTKQFRSFLRDSQRNLQQYCGVGKPIGGNSNLKMMDLVYINNALKKELTSVFLGLEAEVTNQNYSNLFAPSFRTVLSNILVISKNIDLFNRLIELRNIWFHGHYLGDEVILGDGRKVTFDFYKTMDTLSLLRDALIDYEQYDAVTVQIETFGMALLDLKALKLVEMSYKLLDSRLCNAEHLEDRINRLERAYASIEFTEDRFFKAVSSLLGIGPIDWNVHGSRFSGGDCLHRNTLTDELKVILLYSKTGFDIGSFHSDVHTLPLVDVSLLDEYALPINGKKLKDYSLRLKRDICSRIKVYEAI